jgi:uncharacterized protein YmfQ (DUF2313 family)
MSKTCKITNGKFAWILEVDDQTINFQGSYSAEYFAELYKRIGYNVEINYGLQK